MRALFIDFLIDNDVFDAWVSNLSGGKDPDDFLNAYKPASFLGGAFEWEASPEKHGFWSDLNYIWEDKIKEKTSDCI